MSAFVKKCKKKQLSVLFVHKLFTTLQIKKKTLFGNNIILMVVPCNKNNRRYAILLDANKHSQKSIVIPAKNVERKYV